MKLNHTVYYSHQKISKIVPASFPHRSLRRQLPTIGQKHVPIHCLQIKRSYQGQMNQLSSPERWAYIPFQQPKKSKQKQNDIENQRSKLRIHSQSMLQQLKSTSQVLFKKYLKRKQKKQMGNPLSLTTYAITNDKERQSINSNQHPYLNNFIDLQSDQIYQEQILKPAKHYFQSTQESETSQNYSSKIYDIVSKRLNLLQRVKQTDTQHRNKLFAIKVLDKKLKNINRTMGVTMK